MDQISTGLRPVGHINGVVSQQTVLEDGLASGYAASLFYFDPLQFDGRTGRYVRSDGTSVDAIFVGCRYEDVRNEYQIQPSWQAGTVTNGAKPARIHVETDMGQRFEIQADATVDRSIIGKACNIDMGLGGDHRYGRSHCRLDVASAGTGTAVRVIDFARTVGNVPGTDATLLVEVI